MSKTGRPTTTWREKRIGKVMEAFEKYEEAIYQDGALDLKTKEIIATVTSGIMRCEHCTEIHLKNALALGATKDQIAEAIAVAMVTAGGNQAYWTNVFQDLLG